MATVSMTLDPNAASYTDNEIIDKINAATSLITRATCVSTAASSYTNDGIITMINDATTQITRATCVSSAARVIGTGEITNTNLTAGSAKLNLDAMSDTTRGYVVTNPSSGQFKIISVQRDSTGKLEVKYDNVAV